MRVWVVPYSLLDDRRLQAQHREVHMLAGLAATDPSPSKSGTGLWKNRADYLAKVHQVAQWEIELRATIRERSEAAICLSCGISFKQGKPRFDVPRAESGFQCLGCGRSGAPISPGMMELWQGFHPPAIHKTPITPTLDIVCFTHPQEVWCASQEAIRADVVALREKWEAEEYYFGVGRFPLAPFEASFDISEGLSDPAEVKQRRERTIEHLKLFKDVVFPAGSRIRDRIAILKARGVWNV